MSAKNRKPETLWTLCEVCKTTFLASDKSIHSDNCPPNLNVWKQPFIRDDQLYTTLTTCENDDENFMYISVEESSCFVLISLQALQLTTICIGQPVLISGKDIVPFIKVAWPIKSANLNSSTLLQAALTKEAADLNLLKTGSSIKISKYDNKTSPAGEITIECESNIKASLVSELLPLIHEQNINRIYCIGNRFIFRHYGKKLIFKIVHVSPWFSDPSLGGIHDIQDFKGSEHYYLIAPETKWKQKSIVNYDIKSEKKDLLQQIGGLNDIISELLELVDIGLNRRASLQGLLVTRGIIIFGAGGTGKTALAEAIAQHTSANVIRIEITQICSAYLGSAERTLRALFDGAKNTSPSVIIIDELDVICPKPSRRTERDTRIVVTLSILMDKLHNDESPVVVLATTSRIDHIDSSLRRSCRFDKEIEIPVPNPNQRWDILKILLQGLKHNLTESDVKTIAESCHGYVGADLAALVNKAAMNFNSKNPIECISISDFEWAATKIKPSAMREIMIEIPNIKWSDIGGQEELKLKLKQAVEWPLKHGDCFKRLGIAPPKGILMFGPPGCSKTMIAKALATESRLNFISVKGPELFSKWVGESEKAVREVFRRARLAAPSIVFFDELDALAGERVDTKGGSQVSERVLAQLLTEMDGVEPLGNVSVVGATNRPDRIDAALLRPGRLDRLVYVPLPDNKTREEIFNIQLKKTPVSDDVVLNELVDKTNGYSGAEIIALCHEAALAALVENIDASAVSRTHFLHGLTVVTPRTPKSLLQVYENYIKK